jgi:endoplasmic reticulum Man9GlcNAc2 1,2-alpha-mannosidase
VEFRLLSQLTGSATYADMVPPVFHKIRSAALPSGLIGVFLDPSGGGYKSRRFRMGGLGDTAYEYFLKLWIQGGKTETVFLEMYMRAMDGMSLVLYKQSASGLYYVGESEDTVVNEMEHLSCYLPGLLALGVLHA